VTYHTSICHCSADIMLTDVLQLWFKARAVGRAQSGRHQKPAAVDRGKN
jgi:hypothetical protein